MKKAIYIITFILLNSAVILGQVVRCKGDFSKKGSFDICSFSDTILVGGWESIYYSTGPDVNFDKKIELHHKGYASKIASIDNDIYVGMSAIETSPIPSIIVLNKTLQKKQDLFLDKLSGQFVTKIIKCDSNLVIGTDENLSIYDLNTHLNYAINFPYNDIYKNISPNKRHRYIGDIALWNDSLIIAVNSMIYITDKKLKIKRLLFNSKSLEHDPKYVDYSYFIKSFFIKKDTLYACNEAFVFKFNLISHKGTLLATKQGVNEKLTPFKNDFLVATYNKGFYFIGENTVIPFIYNESIQLTDIFSFIVKSNDIVYTSNSKGIFKYENYLFKNK